MTRKTEGGKENKREPTRAAKLGERCKENEKSEEHQVIHNREGCEGNGKEMRKKRWWWGGRGGGDRAAR